MQLKQPWRRGFTIIGVGILIGVCGFLYHRYGPRQTPPGQPPFVRLNAGDLPVLIDRFNSGDGTLRVLVMLSPT